MSSRRVDSQVSARDCLPPESLELAGATYSLVRVFKHDFFAATCFYRAARPRAALVVRED
jgi:hypothetical protein